MFRCFMRVPVLWIDLSTRVGYLHINLSDYAVILTDMANGGKQNPYPPRKKDTYQATTWPKLTHWKQKSKFCRFML